MNWHEAYSSDAQALWALIAVPLGFLTYYAVRGMPQDSTREDRFIAVFCLVWTVETLLDPIVGGPIARALGWSDGLAGSAILFLFVYLGDLRVFVLIFGLAETGSLRRAMAFALIVPIATGLVYGTAAWWNPGLPGQWMWLIYELGFVIMAVWLVRHWIPGHCGRDREALRSMLSSCGAYVATYYALWATCDTLILLGIDEGWGLRMLPNQLYYALWVPFVYVRYSTMRSQ